MNREAGAGFSPFEFSAVSRDTSPAKRRVSSTALADAYLKWQTGDGLSAVITSADTAKNDFNLSPSRYVSTGEQAEVLSLDEAVVELREAEEELETANREPDKVLKELGLNP